jgi:hypothetical protein
MLTHNESHTDFVRYANLVKGGWWISEYQPVAAPFRSLEQISYNLWGLRIYHGNET